MLERSHFDQRRRSIPPSVSLGSSPVPTAPTSPFVAISPLYRGVIVAAWIGYLLWVGLQSFLHPSDNSALPWVFAALTLNIGLLLLPIIFYRPSYGWLHPLVFTMIFTLPNHLRKIGTYSQGLQWHVALPGWSQEDLTLLVALELGLLSLGLMASYLGFFLCPTPRVPRVGFTTPRHIEYKAMAMVLLSAVTFLAYVQGKGGLISHLLSWGEGRNISMAGEYYWNFIIQFGLTTCLLWFAVDRQASTKPVFWGCSVLSSALVFLSTGSRTGILFTVVITLMIWLLQQQKMAPLRILSLALIVMLVFGALGNFRNSTASGRIDWGALVGQSSQTQTSTTLGSGLEEATARGTVVAGVYPILALVPKEVGFLHGSSYLAVATLPIPKRWWAGKPGLVPGLVGQVFYGIDVGMPPGAVGEAYWNFGPAGIVLIFSSMGCLANG